MSGFELASRRRPVVGARVAFAASVVIWLLAFRPWHWYMGDLVVYRGGGSAALHGRALYSVVSGRHHLHFTYPPFSALVMVPLSVIPLWLAKTAVSLATFAGVVACLWLVLRQVAAESGAVPPWVLPAACAVAVWLEPVRATVAFGQINAILMLGIVLDLLVLRGSRYHGALVGVAAAIKLTPLAFVVFLVVVVREMRAAAVACAVFVASIGISFAVLPGDSRTYWLHRRFLSAHRIGRVENASNQSARGVLARLLKTQHVPWWWVAVASVTFVVGLYVAYQLNDRGRLSWSMTATAIAMLCASPVSWSHHWVWCVLMLVACYDVASRHSWRYRAAAVAVMFPFIAALAFWAPHVHGRELGDSWWQELFSASYVLAGIGLLALMLGAVRRRMPRPSASSAVLAHQGAVSRFVDQDGLVVPP